MLLLFGFFSLCSCVASEKDQNVLNMFSSLFDEGELLLKESYLGNVATAFRSERNHPFGYSNQFLRELKLSSRYSEKVYKNHIEESIVLSKDGNSNVDCVVKFHDETLWIVVKGTNSVEDIISNLSWMAPTEDIDGFQIPVGIQRKLSTLWPKFLKILKTRSIRKIIFTGHSLGGAVATALYLRYRTYAESNKSQLNNIDILQYYNNIV